MNPKEFKLFAQQELMKLNEVAIECKQKVDNEDKSDYHNGYAFNYGYLSAQVNSLLNNLLENGK